MRFPFRGMNPTQADAQADAPDAAEAAAETEES
jgi:hypothetical protein